MSKFRKGALFLFSFGVSYVYGVHVSQTYDLPDIMKSFGAVFRMFAGDSVMPKKKRSEEDDDDR